MAHPRLGSAADERVREPGFICSMSRLAPAATDHRALTFAADLHGRAGEPTCVQAGAIVRRHGTRAGAGPSRPRQLDRERGDLGRAKQSSAAAVTRGCSWAIGEADVVDGDGTAEASVPRGYPG
jgi:hypothetical protein